MCRPVGLGLDDARLPAYLVSRALPPCWHPGLAENPLAPRLSRSFHPSHLVTLNLCARLRLDRTARTVENCDVGR